MCTVVRKFKIVGMILRYLVGLLVSEQLGQVIGVGFGVKGGVS